jgi:hypothetical protein
MKIAGRIVGATEAVAPLSASSDDLSQHLMIVNWVDIIACAGWETHEEVEVPRLKSVGWLVYSDDEVVKIANTINEEGVGAGITAFPRGCVTKLEKA